jgi:Toprim-like
MSLIADTLLTHLPAKRKHTPSGWISFNAPCCGDKRQRGGFIVNAGDAVSYHCFNCGFKCSWQPGRTLSQKMRKFMRDLNMSDDIINKLGLEALRLNENESAEVRSIVPKFDERALPEDAQLISSFLDNAPDKLIPVLDYLLGRNLSLEDYDFYWTPKIGFSNRVIIPFTYNDTIVGYTARAIGDTKPKYISEQQPGYVFNLDSQHDDREFTIVCEGPFDAISIDACAILGAEIKDGQNWLLKQLGKEIVLVPDKDHEGPRTVEQAIEYGWSVSMPDWPEGVKDVNDAVVKLGKLATLWLIVSAKESNALKIRLRAKQWFRNEYEKTN